MSSLFPEPTREACLRQGLLGAFALASIIGVAPAQAAQTHLQPRIEAGVEQNTNRNLAINPDDEADILGYIVTAEVLWSYVTPKTNTEVRPRVRFQEYPDDKEIQRSEQFLDFSTQHRATERSTFELVGRYSREDSFNSELVDAEFDDLDPDDPIDGGEGTTEELASETRTRVQLRPDFTHDISELTGVAIGGVFQTVRFESESRDRTEYDYLELRTYLTRRLSPLTQIGLGPVVSRYETRDNTRQTDGYGLELGLDHRWSEVSRIRGKLFVLRSEFESLKDGVLESESETNVGFNLGFNRRTELGHFRLNAGRTVRPASGGSTVVQDQVRAQFDHDFSERLSMTTAVRAYTQERVGSPDSDNNRDYARGELGLNWMATPTMFIGGSYQYTWRELELDGTSAKNHAVFVYFGYRGLGRPN
jgi:hypothetical protein